MKFAIIVLISAFFILDTVCLRRVPKPRRPKPPRGLAAIEKKIQKLWATINELKKERSGVHIHFHDASYESGPHHDEPINIPGDGGSVEVEEVIDDFSPVPDVFHADSHEHSHEEEHHLDDHIHGPRSLHYHNAAEVNVRMNLHASEPQMDFESEHHHHHHHEDVHHAHCEVMPNKNSMPEGFTNKLMGPIHLYQGADSDTFHVTVNVTGCPSNTKHGFHVHQYGDMLRCCDSLGPHYNPMNTSHGSPDDDERHEGDFGNVLCTEGKIETVIKAKGHLRDMVGRSIVIHQREDDMGKGGNKASKASGDAGGRVACCVIGLADPEKHGHHEYENHDHHDHHADDLDEDIFVPEKRDEFREVPLGL